MLDLVLVHLKTSKNNKQHNLIKNNSGKVAFLSGVRMAMKLPFSGRFCVSFYHHKGIDVLSMFLMILTFKNYSNTSTTLLYSHRNSVKKYKMRLSNKSDVYQVYVRFMFMLCSSKMRLSSWGIHRFILDIIMDQMLHFLLQAQESKVMDKDNRGMVLHLP